MGVATRGVKFRFSAGEKVLCYEPDPTKAKVLYESKVLDLVVNRDDRGRKVPEYLIHFLGWNSSWDRCVREEFILPFTEENCELQTKLAVDASISIKGKRKSKLPPLIKDTLNKKSFTDSENERSDQIDCSEYSSEMESSEDEKEVKINIPDALKQQLEDDCRLITKRSKLVKLPCQPNVVAILESFVKHSAAKLLCASPPKNSKNGKQLMPDDVQNKLNLCKEAVDGLRVYFDFTLPHLLLYCQERKQYYSEAGSCKPSNVATRDFQESMQALLFKKEGENAMSEIRKEAESTCHHRLKNSKTKLIAKAESCSNKTNDASKERVVKRRGRPPRKMSIRNLRSKNTQPSKYLQKLPFTTAEFGSATTTKMQRIQKAAMVPTPHQDKPPAYSTVSSSNSSTHSSSVSLPQEMGSQLHLINCLQDILIWRLCPLEMYEQMPAAPSMVYGAQHLLRLFVKLPNLVLTMNMSNRKLQPLVAILQSFLKYMQEQKDQFFLPSAYVDSRDIYHEPTK